MIQSTDTQMKLICPRETERQSCHSVLAQAVSGCTHSDVLQFDYIDRETFKFLVPRDDKEKRGIYIASEESLRQIAYEDAKSVVVDGTWTCWNMVFASSLAVNVDLLVLRPKVSERISGPKTS